MTPERLARSPDDFLDFEMSAMAPRDRYKLLVGLVIPRPIALVTTQDADGLANAAPFSFFNIFSEEPPLLVLGIEGSVREPGGYKDTGRNIRASGEFVVNLVDEALLEQMNVCAIDFPPDVDELAEAGLERAPSRFVAPPRIASSPVQLECRTYRSIDIGQRQRTLLIGEILMVHVRQGVVQPENLRVDIDALDLVGRLHGGGAYLRLTDRLRLDRISLSDYGAGARSEAL